MHNLASPQEESPSNFRVIDLDIDIGADAVDYKYDASSSYPEQPLDLHVTAQ